MFTKINFSVAILLFLSIFVLSCSKSDNPASDDDQDGTGGNSQSGAGTMSCKIDGVSWSASIPGSPIAPAAGQYINQTLVIVGTQYKGSDVIVITLQLTNIQGAGEYDLGVGVQNGIRIGTVTFTNSSTSLNESYGTNTNTPEPEGKINITKLDLTNKIASGTFYFKATSDAKPGVVKNITEGKFDVKLQ